MDCYGISKPRLMAPMVSIAAIYALFPDRKVCILGNIDLDYTLTLGTPEEVDKEVKERIATTGSGGGYIVTSANSLTDYCKTENVLAMARAIKKYGRYPLDINENR